MVLFLFPGIRLFAGICVFYMIGTTYTCINGLKLKLSSAKSDNKGKIAEEKASIAGHLSSNSCYIHLYCCHLFVNPVFVVAGGGGFNKILLCFECRIHLHGVCI